jgi:Ca-activated chloride channel homolog
MKFIRFSKFVGFDVSSIDLSSLMEGLSNSLLDSGYNDDYYFTRRRQEQDHSLDGLRRMLLEALINQGILDEDQITEMLAQNNGQFKGSLLEELLNQLIERLVEEGYLNLKVEEPKPSERRGGSGKEVSEKPTQVKFEVTEKGLDFLGFKTLRNLLGSLGKSSLGRHDTDQLATGVEVAANSKPYEFGDTINLDVNTTLLSAIQREGIGTPLNLEYNDLHVFQCDYFSSCATVVMLDCSHSMILYGEDRFTPAKRVALALAHLIRTQYPGDSLKIVLFHDGAEELPLAKLATTQVGPYHTNTAEGLRLSRQLLQGQRKEMKQIVMVTDGKPTACYIPPAKAASFGLSMNSAGNKLLYKNSMGQDPLVLEETFREVQACRKAGIMINTFMLASDYYLVKFVEEMTAMTSGKAYFATPGNLTQFVLLDFLKKKRRRIK